MSIDFDDFSLRNRKITLSNEGSSPSNPPAFVTSPLQLREIEGFIKKRDGFPKPPEPS